MFVPLLYLPVSVFFIHLYKVVSYFICRFRCTSCRQYVLWVLSGVLEISSVSDFVQNCPFASTSFKNSLLLTHSASIVFSSFFCRTTSLLSQVSSLHVRKLPNTRCHIERRTLHFIFVMKCSCFLIMFFFFALGTDFVLFQCAFGFLGLYYICRLVIL